MQQQAISEISADAEIQPPFTKKNPYTHTHEQTVGFKIRLMNKSICLTNSLSNY